MHIRKFNLNLLSVTSLGIGAVIGAGIFALLGQVITLAGNNTYWSFIIAGIAALFSGYSYSKLAGAYPASGGLTDYFHIAFKSQIISGSLAIIYLLTAAISVSMMAKSFGIYADKLLIHYGSTQNLVNIFAAIIILSLGFLNMAGTSEVGKTEIFLVGIKVIILLTLVVAALYHFDLRLPTQVIQTSNTQFLGSIGITFFAYAGYGIITNAAGDVPSPKQTIARAIYLTIIIVIAIYLMLAYVILNYIPSPEIIKNADTAVAIAAQKLLGSQGFVIMYLAAFIAFISGINATLFSMFRVSKSLSQQKSLPQFYHITFWRQGTWGNLLSVILILIATIYFNFTSIVNIASGAYLISYLAVLIANWYLRKETDSSPTLIVIGTLFMLFILITFMFNVIN